MKTWAEMAAGVKLFRDKYADATPQAFVDDLLDLTLVREAAKELREKGLLKSP